MTASLDAPDRRLVQLIAGLDTMATSERAAEHLLNQVLGAVGSVHAEQITTATHRVQVFETAHVAMTVGLTSVLGPARMSDLLSDVLAADDGTLGAVCIGSGGVGSRGAGSHGVGLPALQASARQAEEAHRTRRSGRVVHFPGSDTLTGTVTVGQALATAIDRVDPLGGGELQPEALLVTRDFLRPRWESGQLVLHVQPAVGGTWVPFETPNPTPCCAIHT